MKNSFRKLAFTILTCLLLSALAWPVLATPRERVIVTASGTIEAEEVKISSESGGRVLAVMADEGDAVEQDQVLVQLDDSLLIPQLAQAEAAVAAAQANLRDIQAPPRASEIAAARAEVARAEANLTGARKALAHAQELLETPHDLIAQIDETRARIAQAEAQIGQAQARYSASKALRDATTGGSDYDKTQRVVYEQQMAAAQAAIAAAEETRDGLKEVLAALEAMRANPLALLTQVHQAEAQVKVAEAQLRLAEAQLDTILAPPQEEKVLAAEAELQQALAARHLLQVQRDKTRLRSPISGLVTSRLVEPGELAAPGSVLLTVADLDQVTLQIYVPTGKIGQVKLGQKATVRVDSFPDREFIGEVVYISDRAEFTPQNVQTKEDRVDTVFAVKLRLQNPEHLLKPGMPADATLLE